MPFGIDIDLIARITPIVEHLATSYARSLPHLAHADIRIDVREGKYAATENGAARSSGDDYGFAFGIRVLAGDRMIAPGYFGRGLGAADLVRLEQLLKDGVRAAYRRAMANAEMKADIKGKFGSFGNTLVDTRLCPVPAVRAVVPAEFAIDPRDLNLDEMVRFTADISRQVAAFDTRICYNYTSTTTELSRELFASSEGALIDQCFALT